MGLSVNGKPDWREAISGDPEALECLKKALADEDEKVREYAQKAIDAMS
jgi:hypothetical protein